MPYRQLIDNCFAQRIGVGGLEVDAYAEALVDAGRALEELRLTLDGGGSAEPSPSGKASPAPRIHAAAVRRFDLYGPSGKP